MKYQTIKLFIVLFLSSLASIAFSEETVDASGSWQLTIVDGERTFTPVFTFEQTGSNLMGTYKNSQGENPAKGSISGNEISFSGQITGRDGSTRWVDYLGIISGDTIKGNFKSSRGDVPFTAVRE